MALARFRFPRPRRVIAAHSRVGSRVLRRPWPSAATRRQAAVPFAWRDIAPALGSPVLGGRPTEARINGWLLVCAAKRIPHLILPRGRDSRLYVPALYENMALHEITAFERERPGLRQEVPARGISPLIPACFLLLAFWHGLRFHWFPFDLPAPLFPAPAGDWAERFGLDIYRVWFSGQWWRCATALTLHADGVHLAGNIVFGLLFLPALCRRAGTGLGLALALLAGILGNAADVALRDAPRISLGFSTALFGSLGSLCGLMGADALRLASAGERLSLFGPKGGLLLPPLAAGLALLGFLGGGAEARTDYAAHVGGFCAGLILAAALLPLDALLRRLAPGREKAVQALLAVLALALFPLAWCLAL